MGSRMSDSESIEVVVVLNRDLANEFAATLDHANEIIVLPIYPAREVPLPGITAETITGKMKNSNNCRQCKHRFISKHADDEKDQ